MEISPADFLRLIRLLETYQTLVEELIADDELTLDPGLCVNGCGREKVGHKYCAECRQIARQLVVRNNYLRKRKSRAFRRHASGAEPFAVERL